MKRIFIPALSCGLVMMLASSCVSMDMTPNAQGNSESWYSTEAELEMAANRLYTIGYWNSPYEDTEQWTDNFTYRQQNRHPDNGAPLNGNLNGQDYIVYHMWEQDYKQIAQANLILQHSGRAKANGVNEDIINQYRAEAYFARACKYAELISYFGAVPYMEKEMTISEASALGRMPLDELVPKVYADFDHAIDSLPETYTGAQRFTKGAALAMKARFALYQADWQTAAAAAKACMDLGLYSLDPSYSNVFLQTTKENPEKIFVIPRSIALGVTLDVWFVNNELPRNVGGYGASSPSWDLLACYLCTDGKPIDESDLFDPHDPFKNRDPRCSMTIVPFGSAHCGWYYEPYSKIAHSTDGVTTKNNVDCRFSDDNDGVQNASYNGLLWKKGVDDTWLDETGKNSKTVESDFIMMRYADVLLMYAEAMIELDKIDQALIDQTINTVRARAYGVNVSATSAYPAVVAGDQASMRRVVRLERRVELAKENLRYMDVIRWGQYDKAFNGVNYILPGEKEVLEDNVTSGKWFWGDVVPQIDEDGFADLSKLEEAGLAREGAARIFPSHQKLWPIPTHDRELCGNLEQNPDY